MNIGNKIKELRLQEGLSLSSFVKEVNISPRVLRKIEDCNDVKDKYVDRIESRYGVVLETFSIDLTDKPVSERILYYRTIKEYTRVDFAKNLGVNKTYICDIENGRRNPSAPLLSKIAKILEVDLKSLVNDKPNNNSSVGYKVRYYRRLNGLTQKQLSDLLGTHSTYIGRVERDIIKLSKARRTQLADILSINEKDLQ